MRETPLLSACVLPLSLSPSSSLSLSVRLSGRSRSIAFAVAMNAADLNRKHTYRVVHPLRRKKKPRAPQLEAVLLHRCARKIRPFVPPPPPPPPPPLPPPPPPLALTAMMLMPSSPAFPSTGHYLFLPVVRTPRATNGASFFLFLALDISLSLFLLPSLSSHRTYSYAAHDMLNTNKTDDDDVPSTSASATLSLSLVHTPRRKHTDENTHARTQHRRNCWGRTTMVERQNRRGFSCRADRATELAGTPVLVPVLSLSLALCLPSYLSRDLAPFVRTSSLARSLRLCLSDAYNNDSRPTPWSLCDC